MELVCTETQQMFLPPQFIFCWLYDYSHDDALCVMPQGLSTCSDSHKGYSCASLVKTTNASFIWSMKENVNRNLFSGNVQLIIQSLSSQT